MTKTVTINVDWTGKYNDEEELEDYIEYWSKKNKVTILDVTAVELSPMCNNVDIKLPANNKDIKKFFDKYDGNQDHIDSLEKLKMTCYIVNEK